MRFSSCSRGWCRTASSCPSITLFPPRATSELPLCAFQSSIPLGGAGFRGKSLRGTLTRGQPRRGSISHRTEAGRDRRAAGDSLVSHGQTGNSTFHCWKEKFEEKKKNPKPCGSFLSAAARTEGALDSLHRAREELPVPKVQHGATSRGEKSRGWMGKEGRG